VAAGGAGRMTSGRVALSSCLICELVTRRAYFPHTATGTSRNTRLSLDAVSTSPCRNA
jgi:hypothetical protein